VSARDGNPPADPPRLVVPAPGWKIATNARNFRKGGVFGFYEFGQLWAGVVEEVDTLALRVKVRDIRPGVIDHTAPTRNPLS
jgi:hypothetical protein